MPKQIALSRRWRTPHLLNATLLVAMLWYPAGVRATAEDGSAMFSFSGFGTLGVVHSSETQADFTTSFFKPNGAGYTDPWSTNVDSNLGAQVTAHFTSQLSAVVQVISEQQYDNTYRPYVEWANVSYQLTPDFTVRAGRTVLATFLFSDTREVGYANPWVRPPVEMYHLVPITNSDGVDASYKVHMGDVVHTIVGSYGQSNPRLPGNEGDNVGAKAIRLISDTIEYGAATAHLVYQDVRLGGTIPRFDELLDAFRQFGPQGIALAEKYTTDNKRVRFIGVGAMYDPGGWFVVGEWAHEDFHSVLGSSTAWYTSGGYRISKFTPYLTYSDMKVTSNRSDPGLSLSAVPPSLIGTVTGLNAGLNAVLAIDPVQSTISVGTRWDFMKNASFKLQYDHTRLGAGSSGTLINIQPGFTPGGAMNLFSATVDFVL
jgi:hypothetical protein